MSRLLFVASEAYPLIKTGGLGDVAGSLPEVLRQQGMDVRLLLPAYHDVLSNIDPCPVIGEIRLGGESAQLLETRLPGTELVVWLVQHPAFSEREGNPYHAPEGEPWHDNAWRFLLLCQAAESISVGQAGLDWQPDVLHANDWHTGLAVALVHQHAQRPRTVFTIHNLAHMGVFDRETFDVLGLPASLWSMDALEFHGRFSFMKAGLAFADCITTVSPTYAREICSAPAGMGLEGLLSHRRGQLHGILNGIDDNNWNPATDVFLPYNFDAASLERKAQNRASLRKELGLTPLSYGPMVALIGRLVEQKGIGLLLPIIDHLLTASVQVVILGTGEVDYERALQRFAQRHPSTMSVTLAFDEGLAHRIEAAADIFMMPSLFEPCGLNQLYSLKYGTLPVIRRIGGLADTVVDATEETITAGTATGFVFDEPESGALLDSMRRAMALWQDAPRWKRMQRTAMAQDFSWQERAREYRALYQTDLAETLE